MSNSLRKVGRDITTVFLVKKKGKGTRETNFILVKSHINDLLVIRYMKRMVFLLGQSCEDSQLFCHRRLTMTSRNSNLYYRGTFFFPLSFKGPPHDVLVRTPLFLRERTPTTPCFRTNPVQAEVRNYKDIRYNVFNEPSFFPERLIEFVES